MDAAAAAAAAAAAIADADAADAVTAEIGSGGGGTVCGCGGCWDCSGGGAVEGGPVFDVADGVQCGGGRALKWTMPCCLHWCFCIGSLR